jgi:hypothetical protein
VFGDSIGCAIVQHLSRKELSALDNKEITDTKSPNTVLPLLVSDVEHGTSTANHVVNTTYDNPIFINQSETYKDNTIDRTKL